jgi:phospholipid/cholesterol/gamma-HCH transport system substrate-binding protein
MRKKNIWLLEIVIWFFLLIGLINFGFNFFNNYLNDRKTYNVTFKDVDGLIVGSPVRMMGIQVGHVIKVRPIFNNVDVTFVINQDNVHIPEKSSVNIQFTGLAGSKSLEILPESNESLADNPLQVMEPIRISSVIDVQQDITQSVLDCSNIALNMLGNGGVDEFKKNIKFSTTLTQNIYNTLSSASNTMKLTNDNVEKSASDIKEYLSAESELVESISNQTLLSTTNTKQIVMNFLNNVYDTSRYLESDNSSFHLRRITNNIANTSKKIETAKTGIYKFNLNSIYGLHQSASMFSQGCYAVSCFVENNFSEKNIKTLRDKTHNLKNLTIPLQKSNR